MFTTIENIVYGMEGEVELRCQVAQYRIKRNVLFLLLNDGNNFINAVFTSTYTNNKLLASTFLPNTHVEVCGTLINTGIEYTRGKMGIEIKVNRISVVH
jgi:aspartyl/asparaginyl-tRNA synthetase